MVNDRDERLHYDKVVPNIYPVLPLSNPKLRYCACYKKGHGLNHHGLFYDPTYLVYPSSPTLAESTTVGTGAASAESTAVGAGSGGFSPQNVASVLT